MNDFRLDKQIKCVLLILESQGVLEYFNACYVRKKTLMVTKLTLSHHPQQG